MRKFLSFIVLASLFFASCSSDGDRGPQGPPGEDGINILGQSFETPAVDFNDPDYSIFVEIPSDIEILPSDIVLVYWLEDVDDNGNDIWTLTPQTIYLDEGQFQYTYNHTDFDVNIFLQANIERSIIDDFYTQDQIFRIVVLPVDEIQGSNLDVSNYQNLKASINLKESNTKAKVH